MAVNSKIYLKKELQISQIEKMHDRLNRRAGLALFMEYLHAIEIFPWLQPFFGTIRNNRNGTSRRLSYFDQLKKDAGYTGTIETCLCSVSL